MATVLLVYSRHDDFKICFYQFLLCTDDSLTFLFCFRIIWILKEPVRARTSQHRTVDVIDFVFTHTHIPKFCVLYEYGDQRTHECVTNLKCNEYLIGRIPLKLHHFYTRILCI